MFRPLRENTEQYKSLSNKRIEENKKMFQQIEEGQKVVNTQTKETGVVLGIGNSVYFVNVDGKDNLENWAKHDTYPFRKDEGEEGESKYNQVKRFHEAFNHPAPNKPTVMDFDTAYNRSKWVIEEVIEHLAATDFSKLSTIKNQLIADVGKMVDKELDKTSVLLMETEEDILMNQADALIDQLYFVYGSLVTQGISPDKLFKIVNSYNMDKLENGQIVYKDESKTKIGKRKGWLPPDEDLKKELRRQIKEAEDNA